MLEGERSAGLPRAPITISSEALGPEVVPSGGRAVDATVSRVAGRWPRACLYVSSRGQLAGERLGS